MKKYKLLFTLILCVTLFLVIFNSGYAQEKPFILRISHSASPEDFQYKGYEQFISRIEERSDGRIKCEHYHSSQMTVDRTAVEFVRDNIVQLGSSPASIILFAVNDKRWGIYSIPFYFGSNDDNLYKITDGKATGLLIEELEEKMGYKVFGVFGLGWSDVGNTRREVKTLEDMKGLKIRVPESPLWVGTFNALGCNATPMNYGEVYTGLQQKTIDGLFTIANLFITSRFADYTKFHNQLGIGSSVHTLFMNRDFYESLPEDLRQMVDEEIRATLIWWRNAASEAQDAVYEKLEDMGIVVTRITPELLAECQAAVQPVIDELILPDIGEEFMEMVDKDWKESERAY